MFQVNSGTAGDDAYTGGAGSIYGRFINTLDGNDTVQVQSSVDSVDLGSGNDVMGVAGPTLVFGAAINTVGGIGTDTIRLDTAATYNLLNILNLSGFEKIDMATAATVEPLGLTLDMVQGMTAGNTVANLLRIDGGTNDVLNLNAAGITAATVAVGNAFFNDVTIAGKKLTPQDVANLSQPITIESRGGKIANSHDGLTFFYTRLPTSQNFILQATVTVNQFGPENGARPAAQEGAGLLVRDVIGNPRQQPLKVGYEEFPAASNMEMNAIKTKEKNE